MQTLALTLIRGDVKELRTLPDALHLRCYILVPICQGVDSVVQQEPLIIECAQSPFLGLCDKREIWFAYEVQRDGMWISAGNRETIKLQCHVQSEV